MLKRLAGDSVWNIVGQAIPALVALAVIPQLVRLLGETRFGALSLAWALVGFFGLFDFGLSRSLTHSVASANSTDPTVIPSRIRGGIKLLVVLGTLGALATLLVYACLPKAVIASKGIDPHEVELAVWALAATVPTVTLTQGMRGAIEGLGLFRKSNLLRLPQGTLTFLLPWLVSIFTPTLFGAIAGLLAARLIGAALFAIGLDQEMRRLPDAEHQKQGKEQLRSLLRYGGWLSVSNILSPIMTTLDRFVIAAKATLAAVSVYSICLDLIGKSLMVPAAISNAAFPKLAGARGDLVQIRAITTHAVDLLIVVFLPLSAFFALFSTDIIALWIGADMAARANRVMSVLAIGIFINALAHIPFALVQAIGRPDLTASAHLIEAIPYIALLFLLLAHFGVEGAAAAWAIRAALDLILLLYFAGRAGVPMPSALIAKMGATTALIIGCTGLNQLSLPIPWRVTIVLALCLAGAAPLMHNRVLRFR
jgi:O-antigen/teichoic acid export membrane protein